MPLFLGTFFSKKDRITGIILKNMFGNMSTIQKNKQIIVAILKNYFKCCQERQRICGSCVMSAELWL